MHEVESGIEENNVNNNNVNNEEENGGFIRITFSREWGKFLSFGIENIFRYSET